MSEKKDDRLKQKNTNPPNSFEQPGRGGAGGPVEKSRNEPLREDRHNHTTEFERPSESTIDAFFDKKKEKN